MSITSLRSLRSFSEGHVLIDGRVWVQGVVLENHRDIPVLGGDVVHQLAVDVKLTLGDLLKTCDHSQRRGLAAAGGPTRNDELLIGDVKAELLHRDNALLGYLELGLAFPLPCRPSSFSSLFSPALNG